MIKFCPHCRQIVEFMRDNLGQGSYRCGNCFFIPDDAKTLSDFPSRRATDAIATKNR